MKCLFCGAEVEIGKRCEYCGSMAEFSYYPKEKPKKKSYIMLNCSDFDEYAVVKGDCLWNITKRYYGKTSIPVCYKIAEINGIENPNLIYPGQIIKLPKGKVIQ